MLVGLPQQPNRQTAKAMSNNIQQSDWKHFKTVREQALQRLCERALDYLVNIASDSSSTCHERYLDVYRRIQEYDKQIAYGFNDLSRSKMLQQIAIARTLDLIDDDQMGKFTQETQDSVSALTQFGER